MFAILNYGIIEKDKAIPLPFHIVDGVIYSYAFMKKTDDGVLTYENSASFHKAEGLKALGVEVTVMDISTSSKKRMVRLIKDTVKSKKDLGFAKRAILFRFERTGHDDSIYTEGMELRTNEVNILDFGALKITPEAPYQSFEVIHVKDDYGLRYQYPTGQFDFH